jgi:hypothetical protein
MLTLSPYEYPVDRVISETLLVNGEHTSYRFTDMGLNPQLPIEEIQGLHESGLSTDENGETIFDHDDPEIPWGWRVIEADDMSLFLPEEIL